MKNATYTQDDYNNDFKSDPAIQKKALEYALDIRKFEIDLYWKRAAYFWAFIAAIFTGYITVGTISKEVLNNKKEIILILSCLGIVFSFAWVLVNKGSKQWQENWENHVDLLEDEIIGPLYKVTISRTPPKGWYEKSANFFSGPSFVSVSKINQLISLFIFLVWLYILAGNIFSDVSQYYAGVLILITVVICVFFTMPGFGRTHSGEHWHQAKKRESTIYNKIKKIN